MDEDVFVCVRQYMSNIISTAIIKKIGHGVHAHDLHEYSSKYACVEVAEANDDFCEY